MTPIRRHLQRIEAIKAGSAEAITPIAPAADPAGLPSLASQHRMRTSASVTAALALAAQAAAGAANDNEAPTSAPTGEIPAYHLRILELVDDRKRLKQIQSVEAKIALKRDLLPKYSAWVDGYLQAAAEASGKAAQDDVVATIMIWRIDVGDFAGALEIAEVLIRNGLKLPEQFARDAATYVTEEISTAAITAAQARKPFDLQQLLQVEDLSAGRDMPDQVRAKLYKAIGSELLRQTEDPDADSAVAGGRGARLVGARDAFARALELNANCGVKKDLEKVTREQNKEQPHG